MHASSGESSGASFERSSAARSSRRIALTTAAGFGALAFCDFDGLRDLGYVGALGSVVGLIVALVVVPAGLRSSRREAPITPSR